MILITFADHVRTLRKTFEEFFQSKNPFSPKTGDEAWSYFYDQLELRGTDQLPESEKIRISMIRKGIRLAIGDDKLEAVVGKLSQKNLPQVILAWEAFSKLPLTSPLDLGKDPNPFTINDDPKYSEILPSKKIQDKVNLIQIFELMIK